MDAHFRSVEQESRLKTSLNTVGTEHFDQVVAISQGMINYAIKKMHLQYEDLNTFDGKSMMGSITADLDPSQLIVPAGKELAQNTSFVIWRLNFKTGTFVAKTENGDKKYPVDGWSVDIRVPLSFGHLEEDDEDSTDTKASKATQRDWIAENFEVPGDYSPERLYAKMSDARWDNISFVGQTFHADGNRPSYEEWKRNPENIETAAALKNLIEVVCKKREALGLTNIGTRFNFAKSAAKPIEKASYPPVFMIHQAYPYKIGPESGESKWADGVKGVDDPGSRNCLLYCENVDKRKMNGLQIQQGGNFTTIGHPDVKDSRVEGTFALSHQLFFEKFLLPYLQPLVLESQIFPSQATFSNKDDGAYGVWIGYRCGYNPADPQEDATKDIYKFQRVEAKDGQDASYEAKVNLTTDTPLFKHPTEWSKHYGEGSPKVTVKWEKGGSRITIEGSTSYQTHITTGDHEAVDPGSHYIVPARSWWHDYFLMTWKITIDIDAQNGGLVLVLKHDSDFVKVADNSKPKEGWHWNNEGTPADIIKTIDDSMTTQLEYLKTILNQGFSDQLKFLYPGRGQLDFGKTVFNQNGDLLAEIRYKDLPSDTKVPIPRVPMITTSAPQTGSTLVGKSVGGSPPPQARLSWTSNAPLTAFKEPTKVEKKSKGPPKVATGSEPATTAADPAASHAAPTQSTEPEVDRRVEFRFNGKNSSSTPVYLSKIAFKFAGHVNGDELLRSVKFVRGPKGKQDEVEFSVEGAPPAVSALSKPNLESTKLSSRSSECVVTLTADEGPITVQPGGIISLIAKSIPGNPINSSVTVTETWCDDKGILSSGLSTWEERVSFALI